MDKIGMVDGDEIYELLESMKELCKKWNTGSAYEKGAKHVRLMTLDFIMGEIRFGHFKPATPAPTQPEKCPTCENGCAHDACEPGVKE